MRVFVFTCAVGLSVQGAVIAGWDVDGIDLDDGIGVESNVPPFTFYSTTSDAANVSAALTLGDGVIRSTAVDQYGFKVSSALQTNSLAGAIVQDQYIDFSITVDDGHRLNLDSIEMNGGGSGTACSNIVLMTSIDGFSAGQQIASVSNANTTGGIDTDIDGFGGPIDLSAAKYQQLTGIVSFRLYGWNSTSGSGSTRIRDLSGDDLVVYGEVVNAADGEPTLSFSDSNGTAYVLIDFNGTATTNYVLQSCGDMVSNIWITISAPFAADTNWVVEATNNAGFYRIIPD